MAIAPPTPAPPKKMTFEEFLDWAPDNRIAEWVDGEVLEHMPSSTPHQLLLKFLLKMLDEFVEAYQLGMVLFAPFLIRLRVVPSGREPDILFISSSKLAELQNTYFDGAPDLAVEIVSPDSRKRDSVDKMKEYEQAGVREYWLLDQPRKKAEFFELGEDGRYHSLPVTMDGVFKSTVVEGFWLNVEWLWQDTRPTLDQVMQGWGLR